MDYGKYSRRSFLKMVGAFSSSVRIIFDHSLDFPLKDIAAGVAANPALDARRRAILKAARVYYKRLAFYDNCGVHFYSYGDIDRQFFPGQGTMSMEFECALYPRKNPSLKAMQELVELKPTEKELMSAVKILLKNDPEFRNTTTHIFNEEARARRFVEALHKKTEAGIDATLADERKYVAGKIAEGYKEIPQTIRFLTHGHFKVDTYIKNGRLGIELRTQIPNVNSTDFAKCIQKLARYTGCYVHETHPRNEVVLRSRITVEEKPKDVISAVHALGRIEQKIISNEIHIYSLLMTRSVAGAPSKTELSQGRYDEFGAHSRKYLDRQREEHMEYSGRY